MKVKFCAPTVIQIVPISLLEYNFDTISTNNFQNLIQEYYNYCRNNFINGCFEFISNNNYSEDHRKKLFLDAISKINKHMPFYKIES